MKPAWAGKRINYGKDHCVYAPKSQQAAAQAAQAAAVESLVAQSVMLSLGAGPSLFGVNTFGSSFSPYNVFVPDGMNLAAAGATGRGMQGMNRTVYLGNIHPETTTEDLCNAIHGGMLQSMRYMQDKHIVVHAHLFPFRCVHDSP